MRILALVTDAYGGRGGIAQAARDIIDALAANPAIEAIDVLARHAPERPDAVPSNVALAAPVPERARYALHALAKAFNTRPELVFCNHLFMAPLAALAAHAIGAQLIVQLHGVEIWREPTALQRRALEKADLVFCVSRDTRARALALCEIKPERAIVINNTVDPRFTPGDRDMARRKLGLRDEFALLSVGRLDPLERYKGHDRVIAAMPRLTSPEGGPPIYLIAGDGDDRSRLESLAAATGSIDRVRFLGQVAGADLPDLYRAADLFVLPSSGEGFGIVYLEAMACGTPALGLKTGGAVDALAEGALGMAVDKADFAQALAHAIAAPRRNEQKLSAAVHGRFGRDAQRQSIARAISRLQPTLIGRGAAA